MLYFILHTRYEEIKSGLDLRTACCLSLRKLLSSSCLFKITKFRIQRKQYFLLICMRWNVISLLPSNIEWGILGIKCWGNCFMCYEATGYWWICITRRIVICIDHEIVFGWSSQEEWRVAGRVDCMVEGGDNTGIGVENCGKELNWKT